MVKREEQIEPWLGVLARALCGVAGLIALAAIVGWMLDNSYLKAGMPSHPPMLLSSALAWCLASMALWVSIGNSHTKLFKFIQRLLAIAVILLGFCAASDSPAVRAAIEDGIASLLPYKRGTIIQDANVRGGLTPTLFGIALLCFYSRRLFVQRIYQAAAILPISISLLALIGHAYDVGSFYGVNGLPVKTLISLPGAVAAVLFGAALLAARPELESTQLLVSKTVGGYVARRLLLAPVLVPVASGFLLRMGMKSRYFNPEIANWLLSFTNIFVFTIVIGLISFLLQRTDLKRLAAEETILHLNDNLEDLVRKRTDELTKTNLRLEREIEERKKTEQQLLRAQRVECLGALAGGIAHDLNNMLSPIAMAAALVQDELATEESKRYMDIISKSAQRGTDLIRQIMIFARGAKGEMQKLDVSLVLRDLQKTMEATLPRSIRFQVKFAPELPQVLGDPTQICQVLMNLCVNARDAMPNGGTIKMEAARSDAEGDLVQITVSDTGTGIPEKNLAVIFEPFFTTKDPGKGTGLGLATVKKIVETHGGTVRVRSELGKGTAFTVTFPATSKEAPKRASTVEEFKGAGQHILVVEDELALREILKATLEQAQYVVTVASNGMEAMQAAQQTEATFELVLTDFEMPFMAGDALVGRLGEHLPEVPFVVMTGSLELAGEKKWDASEHTLLPKPFTTSELLRVVHGALYSVEAPSEAVLAK